MLFYEIPQVLVDLALTTRFVCVEQLLAPYSSSRPFCIGSLPVHLHSHEVRATGSSKLYYPVGPMSACTQDPAFASSVFPSPFGHILAR